MMGAENVFGIIHSISSRSSVARIREVKVSESGVCQCGTRIGVETIALRVGDLPDSVVELFRNRSFCSVRCIRAYCLEALETLDSLETIESESIVLDLHAVVQALARAFAQIVAQT
jgi:hypothetical protein